MAQQAEPWGAKTENPHVEGENQLVEAVPGPPHAHHAPTHIRKMARLLRTCTALTKDQSSCPSTHVRL